MNNSNKQRLPSMWELANPTLRQKLAYHAIASRRFVLCGGASGGGKSQVIEWGPIMYLVDYAWRQRGIPNVEVGVFCENFPMIEDRQLRRCKTDYPDWLGIFHQTPAGPHFTLREEYGGGKVLYRNLDDPQKYRSASYAAIFVEELTLNAPKKFDELRYRIGWNGLDHSPFVGATNPGGPMHGLCKKIWIDRNPGDDLLRSYTPEDFVYIPFGFKHNPYLSQSRIDALNSLPEPQRSAMRDGNWDAFAGMFFASFSRKDLVVPTFQIPPNWPLYGGLDPGWTSPCSFGLYAVEPLHHKTKEGIVYNVATYYERGRNSAQHARAVAEWLKEELAPWTGGRLPQQTFAGTDAFAHKDRNAILSSEVTMADEFLRAGIPLTPAITARVPGAAQFRGVVDRRMLKFFDGLNEPVLAEMEAMLGDDLNPEDIKGRGNDPNIDDHAFDSTRYALMSIYRPTAPKPRNPVDPYDRPEPDEYDRHPLQRAFANKSTTLRNSFRGGRIGK